jgi:peptide/nickel transport system substrate-binding protein
MKRAILFINILIVASMLLSACATPTPEIIKEVVTQVVKETVVQKEIVKETVIVEGTPQVVEKEVTKVVEVEKVVTPTPEEKETKKLTWAVAMGTNCLDPAFQTGLPDYDNIMNIYNGLVAHKPGFLTEVNPDLATRWDVSDDGFVYTFHLRPGVKWDQGYGELTAEDVKYSWERIINAENGERGGHRLAMVESIEAVDPLTVKVTLKHPFPPFLINMAHSGTFKIVNKKAIEERGEDYCLNPVGTGPYRVVWAETNGGVLLEANEDSFMGRPVIDEVEMRVTPEESVAVLALKAGEIDFMIVREPANIKALREEPDVFVNADENFSASIYALWTNNSREPLGDVRVRRALIHALDRETMVREATEGMLSLVAHSIVPPSLLGHTNDVDKYEYDPEKAKALLAEAGYPDGFKITADSMKTAFNPVMLTMVQGYWKEIGVELEINYLDRASIRQHQKEGSFDITVSNPTRAEVDQIMDSFRCGNIPPAGPNYAQYKGPCELIEAQASELDTSKRIGMLKEIQQRIATDAPVVPLWYPVEVTAARTYVKGLVPNLGWWTTMFWLFDIEK